MATLNAADVEQLVQDKLGIAAVCDTAEPVFMGHTSLLPLGRCGHAVVYQDSAGAARICVAPFGLGMEDAHAA